VTFKRTSKKHFMNMEMFIEDLVFFLNEKVKVDMKSVQVHKHGKNNCNAYYSHDELINELKTKYSIEVNG
jgi:hypothetical protein